MKHGDARSLRCDPILLQRGLVLMLLLKGPLECFLSQLGRVSSRERVVSRNQRHR